MKAEVLRKEQKQPYRHLWLREKIAVGCLATFLPFASYADYQVTGPIHAQECTDYILLESCSKYTVTSIKGDDGEPHEIKAVFPEVGVRENGGFCRIDTKFNGSGLWIADVAINAYRGRLIFITDEGKEIKPDYIYFSCRRT